MSGRPRWILPVIVVSQLCGTSLWFARSSRSSRTPVGLYVRQKWIGEQKDSRWKSDFDATVDLLLAGQSADGSWNHSLITTIRRLFGLHLTVRNPIEPINKALDWLLNLALRDLSRVRKDFREQITSQDLLSRNPV